MLEQRARPPNETAFRAIERRLGQRFRSAVEGAGRVEERTVRLIEFIKPAHHLRWLRRDRARRFQSAMPHQFAADKDLPRRHVSPRHAGHQTHPGHRLRQQRVGPQHLRVGCFRISAVRRRGATGRVDHKRRSRPPNIFQQQIKLRIIHRRPRQRNKAPPPRPQLRRERLPQIPGRSE